MSKLEPLVLEEQYKDRTFTTYIVNGLSVEEMDEILRDGEKALVRILDEHNGGCGTMYKCGYGIYEIKHFGGHLLMTTGNSCD